MLQSLKEVFKNTHWVASTTFIGAVQQLFQHIFLATNISAADYGDAAITAVIFLSMSLISEGGLQNCLLVHNKWSRNKQECIYFFSFILSTIVTALFLIITYLYSLYLNNDQIFTISKIYSVAFIIQSVSRIYTAIDQKNQAFKKLFIIESSCRVFSFIVFMFTIYFAEATLSLALAHISFSVSFTLIYLIISKNIFLPRYSRKDLREEIRFCKYTTLTNTQNLLLNNIDIFILSKSIGASELGAYTFFRTIFFRLYQLSNIIAVKSILPLLADKKEAKRNNFRNIASTSYLALLSTGFLFSPFAISLLIPFMHDTTWASMLWVSYSMASIALFRGHLGFSGLDFSLNKIAGKQFLFTSFTAAANVIILLFTSRHSLEFAVNGMLIINMFSTLSVFYYLNKSIYKNDLPIFLYNIVPGLTVASILSSGLI